MMFTREDGLNRDIEHNRTCDKSARLYQLWYCLRCGWGLCVFIESEIYAKQRIYRKGGPQYPLCPYCKVRSRGCCCSMKIEHNGAIYNEKFIEKFIQEPKQLRFPIPKKTRATVMERDGYKCAFCGETRNLQIDHIMPVSTGGTNELNNLRVLCKSCNARRVMDDSFEMLRNMGDGNVGKVMSLLGVSDIVAKDLLSGKRQLTKTQKNRIYKAFY